MSVKDVRKGAMAAGLMPRLRCRSVAAHESDTTTAAASTAVYKQQQQQQRIKPDESISSRVVVDVV